MKITAYHGSPFDFDYFDTDYLGINGGEGTEQGFFFAEDKAHAEYWCARNSRERKYEGYDVSPTIYKVEITANSIFESDALAYRYLDELIAAADGADVIKITNCLDDESDTRRTMYFVFDARNIKIINKEVVEL